MLKTTLKEYIIKLKEYIFQGAICMCLPPLTFDEVQEIVTEYENMEGYQRLIYQRQQEESVMGVQE